ncbi:hypothetical protein ZIOFF_063728 [Zingiber officinale]|uniref:Uncharacterized protein n=1 Tax=Zingiber officinale TaxID=94328 RepID=A0A8J5F6X2_ZINOF|nr:hypothetical protein ZIOFF_063728 [Zingiber officinale]
MKRPVRGSERQPIDVASLVKILLYCLDAVSLYFLVAKCLASLEKNDSLVKINAMIRTVIPFTAFILAIARDYCP